MAYQAINPYSEMLFKTFVEQTDIQLDGCLALSNLRPIHYRRFQSPERSNYGS